MLPVGVEVHRRRRLERRALAVVDRDRRALGRPDHHEAAAADVAGARVRHGQRECGRHRGVDGVAALSQNRRADVRRRCGRRDDHAVLRRDDAGVGLLGASRARRCRRREGQTQRTKAMHGRPHEIATAGIVPTEATADTIVARLGDATVSEHCPSRRGPVGRRARAHVHSTDRRASERPASVSAPPLSDVSPRVPQCPSAARFSN